MVYSVQVLQPKFDSCSTLSALSRVSSSMVGIKEPEQKMARLDAAAQQTLPTVGAASGASTDSGASQDGKDVFKPEEHAGMLGITVREPPSPDVPTEFEIISGEAVQLKTFITALHASVLWRLSAFLFEDPIVKLREPLYKQRTPPFEVKEAGAPTGYMEPWNMLNCVKSLAENNLYESSLTMWQFDPAQDKFDGIDLGVNAISWKQYQACSELWNEQRLLASSQNPDKARFIFESFIPSAVKSVDIVKELQEKGTFFQALPACGGNVLLWSLIGALDEWLKKHAEGAPDTREMVIRLLEASLNVTCRMRLAPNEAQIRLDQLGYMDVLRVLGAALGAVSFHEFAMKALDLPNITGKESGPELVNKMGIFGVTFKGKPIDKNVAYSILAIVGMADRGEGLAAVQFLDRVNSNVMADFSKLLRTFQMLRKLCQPDEWQEGTVAVMESMAIALLTGDKAADSFSTEYILPRGRRSCGYVHATITSMKFKKWFLDDQVTQAAGGASTALSLEGLLDIKSKCRSPRAFWKNFAQKEDIEEEPNCIKYTTEKFEAFKETFKCVGDKHAADLIYKVMTNQFFSDFKELAASGAKFSDTFSGNLDDNGDDAEDSLHTPVHTFRASLIDAPIPSTKQKVQFDNAYGESGDAEYVEKLYRQVTGMRKGSVTFHVMDYSSSSAWKSAGLATQLVQKSRFVKSKGPPGKENSLFLLSADLFPNKEMFQKVDGYKQPVLSTDQMKVAAEWTCASKNNNTICLFTDGRTRKIRKEFESIVDKQQTDEQKQFDGGIIYAFPPKGDPRFAKRQILLP